jgi:ABC-2 type transport system ATP-binding protein
LVGKEMVVVQSRTPTTLAQAIGQDLGLTPLIHGDELRFDAIPEGGPVALIERLLHGWQPDILSIAVKQPTLEDVFIHVTGKSAGADDSAVAASALAETL